MTIVKDNLKKKRLFTALMDQTFRCQDMLQRNLRVLNQKEDRTLQQKLYMLEKEHRYTHKKLQQRQEQLIREHRRVVMVKKCEPKAVVNIAMGEIKQHQIAEMHYRGIQTSEGTGFCSIKSPPDTEGFVLEEKSRSKSAPLPSTKPSILVRRRSTTQSSMSLMQMKNIATIDSISEKELAKQQLRTREELERLKQFQKEVLQKRVLAFVESLKDKTNMCEGSYKTPPQRKQNVFFMAKQSG